MVSQLDLKYLLRQGAALSERIAYFERLDNFELATSVALFEIWIILANPEIAGKMADVLGLTGKI